MKFLLLLIVGAATAGCAYGYPSSIDIEQAAFQLCGNANSLQTLWPDWNNRTIFHQCMAVNIWGTHRCPANLWFSFWEQVCVWQGQWLPPPSQDQITPLPTTQWPTVGSTTEQELEVTTPALTTILDSTTPALTTLVDSTTPDLTTLVDSTTPDLTTLAEDTTVDGPNTPPTVEPPPVTNQTPPTVGSTTTANDPPEADVPNTPGTPAPTVTVPNAPPTVETTFDPNAPIFTFPLR